MKKLLVFVFLFIVSVAHAQTTSLDVIDFMRAKFDYNGFTELNSYLALNIHSYDKVQKKWIHHTELPTCPPEFSCESTNWKSREMTRQKPGENILYLNKSALPVPNKIPETFWYNEDSVYNFEEGYARNSTDYRDPALFGLFHNLHHTPTNNPFIEFPYRGSFWTKRFVTNNEVFPWIYQVQTTEYKNMQLLVKDKYPYYYRIRAKYYPDWDGSNSWNNLPNTGNLPRPLEVIELRGESKNDAGENMSQEAYYYARSGSNSFGLVRYQLWEPDANTNSMILVAENTYDILSHYEQGEDPNQYFNPAFYSDPKLEAYPDEPTNGALPRGRFQLPGMGQTTDGRQLSAGSWIQLTEILTDGDWLLSKHIPPNQCPNGYQYLGSLSTNFFDHKGDDQGNNWAIFCGTNKNVLWAVSCPVNYESRGWFDTPTPSTSAYDYQGNAVGGQRLNHCVYYNEFHFPKVTFSNLTGDLNNNNRVDIFDYNILVSKFGNPYTMFDYNQLVANFGKSI